MPKKPRPKQKKSHQPIKPQSPQLPISGMVAVSASLVSLAVGSLLLLGAVAFFYIEIKLAERSLYLLALSSIVLFLGLNAIIGLIAGFVFNRSETQKLSIIRFSQIVNGLTLLFVIGCVVLSVINS